MLERQQRPAFSDVNQRHAGQRRKQFGPDDNQRGIAGEADQFRDLDVLGSIPGRWRSKTLTSAQAMSSSMLSSHEMTSLGTVRLMSCAARPNFCGRPRFRLAS